MTSKVAIEILKSNPVDKFGKAHVAQNKWLLYSFSETMPMEDAHFEIEACGGRLRAGVHFFEKHPKNRPENFGDTMTAFCSAHANVLKAAGRGSTKGCELKDGICVDAVQSADELVKLVGEKLEQLNMVKEILKIVPRSVKAEEVAENRDGKQEDVQRLSKHFGTSRKLVNENFFSDGLRYYLDPRGKHGSGSEFLKLFIEYLKSVAAELGKSNLSCFLSHLTKNLDDVEVGRENGVFREIKHGEGKGMAENRCLSVA